MAFKVFLRQKVQGPPNRLPCADNNATHNPG
jgi:hypothetical protein